MNEDDAPSPEAATISESLVILEFLADLFPNLLPVDPVLRARARFFIKTADEKFSKAFFKFVLAGGSMDDMLDAVMEMQALLPNTGFAVGKWSIADAAFVPFLLRLESLLKNKFWAFAEGVAEKTLTELHAPKFAKIRSYLEDNVARESMTRTWDEVSIAFSCQSFQFVITYARFRQMAALAQIDRRTRRASAQISTLSSSEPSVSVPPQWKDLV